MALGNGWWVGPRGEIIEIYEHLDYVKDNKEKFGLPLDFFMFTDEERALGPLGLAINRERILKEVIRRGWIRVRRAPRMTATFEAWRLTDDVFFRVGEAIHAANLASPSESVRINSVRDDRAEIVNVSDLLAGRVFAKNPPSEVKFEVATLTFDIPLTGQELKRLQEHLNEIRDQGKIAIYNPNTPAVKIANWDTVTQTPPSTEEKFSLDLESWAHAMEEDLDLWIEVDVA